MVVVELLPVVLATGVWSSGGEANMKYIIITKEGTPKISDHKNEVLHLRDKTKEFSNFWSLND